MLVALVVLAVAQVLPGCRRGKARNHGQRRSVQQSLYAGDTLPPVAEQGARQDGGELRVGIEAEPPSLNYQIDPLDALGKKIDELVYESMARPNPRTYQHEPRLAESWEISDDRLTLTFHLRRGVTWHDGKPFTADDVIFTFDRILDPASKTMAIRSSFEPLADYKKLDPYTVRFTLKRPYWYAVDAIAELLIYPRHVFSQGDFNNHPANRAPIGTGAYKFSKWIAGDEIVIVRNPVYFGAKPSLERIVFKVVPDPTVRLLMLRRGDIDVVERLSPETWRELTGDPELASRFYRLRHVPTGLQWIGWNEERSAFRDARVRRALSMLIDREDIAGNLRLGLDTVAASWFYPESPEHNSALRPLPYDPDKALDLLEEAGFVDTNGDGFLDKDGRNFSFTFLYPAGNPFYEQLATLLVSDLGKAGIKVETARLDWAVFMERLRRHEFDACSLLWQLYPRTDPYQIWHSSEIAGGSNFISYRNDELDRVLDQARFEFDADKRVALYRRFSEILRDEQPYTLLFNRYNLSLVSKALGGISSTPYGIFRYEEFYRRAPVANPSPAPAPSPVTPPKEGITAP